MTRAERRHRSATWCAIAVLCAASVSAAQVREGPEPVEAVRRRLVLEGGTVVELARDGSGRATYSIRTADGRASGERRVDRFVRLRSARFDPLEGVPPARHLPSSGSVRLIQLETQVLEEYTDALARLGVEVHRFVPGQTLIARVPPAPRDTEVRVAALPFVRWIGPFPAEHRVEPELLERLVRAPWAEPLPTLVQLVRRGEADQTAVAAAVRALGGRAEPISPEGFLLAADLTSEQLAAVAALDEVLWIERADPPAVAVDKVRADAGADVLEQRTGFTGLGVRGEVMDTGLARGHPDFQSNLPILHGSNSSPRGHGTRVFGVVFGDGATRADARGLLPDGQGIFASFNLLGDRYRHTARLVQPPLEAVFQTNSWGNGPSPAGYPSLSFEMDDIIHRYDLLICQAFGNSGGTIAFRQAWAKNVVTVGGIRHFDTLDTSDDAWNGAGSIGPATDGRIKPDLAYWSDQILTTTNPDTHTETFSGTSAATPAVAGCFGLLFQMWHEETFGNVAGGATVFDSRPRSSTARALMFNTADAYPFSGRNHDLTRTHQGWGRPDVERLHDVSGNVLVIDEWRPLENLERATYGVRVAEGQADLRATLVYTDPPGNSAAARHRVNDLSLRVASPSGDVYWGNAGLDEGNLSDARDEHDELDTTEQVWLANPEPGTWTVEVVAREVVQDAHLETAAVDADFALVVAPVVPAARDLGHGLAAEGHDEPPLLEARGSFVGGSPWRLDLSRARPGSEGLLVIGESLEPRLFGGGILLPALEHTVPLVVDDAGRAGLAGVFPPHRQGGVVFLQAWLHDPTGPRGMTASNALEIRGPESDAP